MSTFWVMPREVRGGVHAKVVAKGEAPEAPSAGLRVAPAGTPMPVMTRLPAVGFVPVTMAEKGWPTGATKVPLPVHVGDGRLEISMITSRGAPLRTPAWVDSTMRGST